VRIEQKVGQRLKELRLKKQMTQEVLAAKAGMERTFISHIENGTRNVSVETMAKLIDALETSFKYFFKADEFK
jgi:transcriptional regulator with XRE-family HTH domain